MFGEINLISRNPIDLQIKRSMEYLKKEKKRKVDGVLGINMCVIIIFSKSSQKPPKRCFLLLRTKSLARMYMFDK